MESDSLKAQVESERLMLGRLFLPIEVVSREIAQRVVLARLAVELGIEVVIGANHAVFREATLRGSQGDMILLKGGVEDKWTDSFIRSGVGLAVMDEEISPSGSGYKHVSERISPHLAENLSLYFSTGRPHSVALLVRYPELRDRTVEVGFGRLDLLREPLVAAYRSEALRIRVNTGRVVLICTSFGSLSRRKVLTNGIVLSNYLLRDWVSSRRETSRSSSSRFWRTRSLFSGGMRDWRAFRSAKNLRRDLRTGSLLPPAGARFILRPHPSEDPQFWEKAVGKGQELTVDSTSRLESLILASEAVVHVHSTTGVQSLALGRPTISLSGIYGYDQENESDRRSVRPQSRTELSRVLDDIRVGGPSVLSDAARVNGSYPEADHLVADKMLRALMSTGFRQEKVSTSSGSTDLGKGDSLLRTIVRRLLNMSGIGRQPEREELTSASQITETLLFFFPDSDIEVSSTPLGAFVLKRQQPRT